MMHFASAIALASVLAFGATAASAQVVQNFDTSGQTGTVDRYAPTTVSSGTPYGGHAGTLEEITLPSNGGAGRPAAYSSSFYNTQGMAFALPAGTTSMSVQLYNDSAYSGYASTGTADTPVRLAGFWGVATDASSQISAYPIIELDKVGNDLVYRGWDSNGNGGWFNLSQGPGATNTWDTLGIALVGTDVNYFVNGVFAGAVNSGGSTGLDRAILQVYNSDGAGRTDMAHWDNLTANSTGAVPEPASWALMILGFGSVGALMRRRHKGAAAAFNTMAESHFA